MASHMLWMLLAYTACCTVYSTQHTYRLQLIWLLSEIIGGTGLVLKNSCECNFITAVCSGKLSSQLKYRIVSAWIFQSSHPPPPLPDLFGAATFMKISTRWYWNMISNFLLSSWWKESIEIISLFISRRKHKSTPLRLCVYVRVLCIENAIVYFRLRTKVNKIGFCSCSFFFAGYSSKLSIIWFTCRWHYVFMVHNGKTMLYSRRNSVKFVGFGLSLSLSLSRHGRRHLFGCMCVCSTIYER